MVNRRITLLSIIALATTLIPHQAFAQINKPKVGNCYNYTVRDVEGDGSRKGPVACNARHTAETYRVARWTLNTSPFQMTDDEVHDYVEQRCLPLSRESAWFNYWAYYLPTEKQWDSRQRWIRCDLMVMLDDSTFDSWRGKKLDVK